MANPKINHRPGPSPEEKTFSELLIDAMSKGLGMSEPNSDGKWIWYDVDLAAAVGCSEKSLGNWRAGRRPTRRSLSLLISVFSANEPHSSEWKKALLDAHENLKRQIEKSTEIAHHAGFQAVDKDLLSKEEERFRSRLRNLCDEPVCIFGPTYLDVILFPVTTSRLGSDVEYSTLEEPEIILGGSSVFLGRYLHASFGRQSDVFSLKPRSEHPLAALWHNALSEEKWISEFHSVGEVDVPPITFALRQARDGSKTMFTYASEKEKFTWDGVIGDLKRIRGRVVHISGLMKTNLRKGFLDNLETIGENNLVVLDHGRFTPDAKERDFQLLIQQAIDGGLVDVQVCGMRDLADLYNVDFDGDVFSDEEAYNSMLSRILAERGPCSRVITIVRDYDYQSRTPVFSAFIFGKVVRIERGINEAVRIPEGFAYAANKFNAALINEIIKNKDRDDLDVETAVLSFVEGAFRSMVEL